MSPLDVQLWHFLPLVASPEQGDPGDSFILMSTDEQDKSVKNIGKTWSTARPISLSFSFDSEPILGGSEKEQHVIPWVALVHTVVLEEAVLADLAAEPELVGDSLLMATGGQVFSIAVASNRLFFIKWIVTDNLVRYLATQLESEVENPFWDTECCLDPTNARRVPPLVQLLHLELLKNR